ncbi:hypothetical protein [Limnofasciculus baicalensis]|uniref:Uncharacterized protein n=1 Tax=Limnofasciculus baicalensis BBK-W-15 TaxID=2699891 RepID=A0AAE3KMH2_9CYAN|nr:hypothetical protein [Limnofasciculus baicalensis]MCP2727648.1 hypothetical protein [Limnofasciculus baicalensis BBK-W-15]
MSRNRYQPHIIILPEDRANEEIANGFIQYPNINEHAIQIERPAGGWGKVIEKFTEAHVPEMRLFTKRMILLLIDFDRSEDRFSYVESQIPQDLKERVFILGVQSNPESLRRDTQKNFEGIGETLAKDCSDNTNQLWGHALLKHNKTELERMILSVKPFLFN